MVLKEIRLSGEEIIYKDEEKMLLRDWRTLIGHSQDLVENAARVGGGCVENDKYPERANRKFPKTISVKDFPAIIRGLQFYGSRSKQRRPDLYAWVREVDTKTDFITKTNNGSTLIYEYPTKKE